MGVFLSLFSSRMPVETGVIRSILKSNKVVLKWRRASKSKSTGFQDNVQVFYFDRCPQYDHAPEDESKIPVGMSSQCFHSQLEPLASHDRETRGNVRRMFFVQHKEKPGPVLSTCQKEHCTPSACSLGEGNSIIDEVIPHPDSCPASMVEEVHNLHTVFVSPTKPWSSYCASSKKKSQEKKKNVILIM